MEIMKNYFAKYKRLSQRLQKLTWDRGHQDLRFIPSNPTVSRTITMSSDSKMAFHSGVTRNSAGYPRFKIKL